MPKPSKKAKDSKFATVANLPVEIETEVQALEVDLRRCGQLGQLLVYGAVRIGIRLILMRESAKHGEFLEQVMTRLVESTGCAQRTLYRYIKVAENFITDAKLKTANHRLKDTAQLKPLLNEQLEFIFNDSAKMAALPVEDILAKLKTWVLGRSLSQIYRDLAEDVERPLPPTPTPSGKLPDKRELQREAVRNAWANFRKGFASGNWQLLPIDELKELRADLKAKQTEIEKLLKHHDQ